MRNIFLVFVYCLSMYGNVKCLKAKDVNKKDGANLGKLANILITLTLSTHVTLASVGFIGFLSEGRKANTK